MLLDVPFILDGEYPAFLADRADALASVHFSLSDTHLADARQRLRAADLDAVIKGLRRLRGVDAFVLMNARLHAPDKLFDAASLDATARLLDTLIEKAGIRGVIFADSYFLNALSDAAPDVVGKLEAVPSINCMLDSPDKVFAMLDLIGRTAFRQPSRLVLDRSLNRDLARLEIASWGVRAACPGMKLHLIANEGCLFQCPYKPAHDAHIALVNEGLCGERTFAMNRDFGCVRRMLDEPGAMLASPFIRPEDMGLYDGLIDGIKLCGRNRGAAFLQRAITAWLNRKYDGNLLDLMDAMGDLAGRVEIPNAMLPEDFAARVMACDKHCAACGWCADTVEAIATHHEPQLKRL